MTFNSDAVFFTDPVIGFNSDVLSPSSPSVSGVIPEIDIAIFRVDNTGKRFDELTDATLKDCSWVLNNFGTATINIDPLSPEAMGIKLNVSEIQIWFDGTLRWWGVPRRVSGGLEEISFHCEDLLSYFLYSFLTNRDFLFTNVEQRNIMSALVQYAQSKTFQNRNIVVGGFEPSGIRRDRHYLQDEYYNIWELMKKFPDLQNGLDFNIELFGDGRREFRTYYPAKGLRKAQYALEIDQYGRKHIRDLEYNKDAVGQVNDIYVTGGAADVGGRKIFGRYELLPSIEGGYGRNEAVFSEGNVDSVPWLAAGAESIAKARGYPVEIPSVIVGDELLGHIVEGDIVPVRVEYGAISMVGDFRINEVKWQSDRTLALQVQPA